MAVFTRVEGLYTASQLQQVDWQAWPRICLTHDASHGQQAAERHSGQYILSYSPLVTSAVADRQMHGPVGMGSTLDNAHYGRLEAASLCL